MKRTLGIVITLAALALAGLQPAFADEQEPATPIASSSRLLKSEPVFARNGRLIGQAEIVASEVAAAESQLPEAVTATAATSASTYSKTCTVEFYLKNIYGQKVISYKLRQTFTYNGSRIVSWYAPVVTSSTKWGWSGSDFTNGSYWLKSLWSKRSWASGTFTLKVAWFTVEQYKPTIGVDGYGSGYCRAWGYW
ncbi:MAG: hypothetical protein WD187_03195 [Candidatus Woykebacteria bacterium]